ncbi:MAG: ribbon-helix-helix protein, CopG family [Polyangiaceae bacterium]|nr:ribbon-helix-helix protein, CopG family [Polyangiaceae bacterium]
MSDLVRFGVAMDRALLAEFDQRIAERGYENRSEALRDLVRADLTKAAFEGDQPVTATLSLVYSRKQRSEVVRLIDERTRALGSSSGALVAQVGVVVDDERALEIVVLRGRASDLRDLAGRVGGVRGVLGSDLSIACVDRERGEA